MWCCWGSVLTGEHIRWTNFKLNIDNYAILNGYAPNLDDYAFVIFNGLMKFTLSNSNRMNWNNILNSIFDFLIQPLNNLISVILCFCLLYKPWLTQIQTDIRPFHTQNSYKICLNMKFRKWITFNNIPNPTATYSIRLVFPNRVRSVVFVQCFRALNQLLYISSHLMFLCNLSLAILPILSLYIFSIHVFRHISLCTMLTMFVCYLDEKRFANFSPFYIH